MSQKDGFYHSAKSLSRNPLGIIALFIVMVYAVASLVISLAKDEFYQNPQHPAVIFLAVFPLVVLVAFTYLVACHHRKLYAPEDYMDQRDFILWHKGSRCTSAGCNWCCNIGCGRSGVG